METQINQRRGLLILLFFTFFMVVGFDMIMPLVIGHYVNNVGLTATAVSVALAIRQFSQQGLAMMPWQIGFRSKHLSAWAYF